MIEVLDESGFPKPPSEAKREINQGVNRSRLLVRMAVDYFSKYPDTQGLMLNTAGKVLQSAPNALGELMELAEGLDPLNSNSLIGGFAESMAETSLLPPGVKSDQITPDQRNAIDKARSSAAIFLKESLKARKELKIPPSPLPNPTPSSSP